MVISDEKQVSRRPFKCPSPSHASRLQSSASKGDGMENNANLCFCNSMRSTVVPLIQNQSTFSKQTACHWDFFNRFKEGDSRKAQS